MRFSSTILALAAFAGLPLVLADVPIKNAAVPSNLVVPNKYIVTYKKNCDPAKRRKHEADVAKKAAQYKKGSSVCPVNIPGYQGYIVELGPRDLGTLTKSPLVEYIEKDVYVNHTAIVLPPDARRVSLPNKRASYTTTQTKAAWGLGRISHRDVGFAEYPYDATAGAGVRVYVMDTGIQLTHEEFGGRAVFGRNFVAGSPNADQNGHGTHVAGTIAGKTFGVAKRATLVAVKVLDASGGGSMSRIIEGLSWVVDDARKRGILRKTVVNMSLGGPKTAAVDSAVLAAVNLGVTVVVAAGNENTNTNKFSPSSVPSVITVAAVDSSDYRGRFSNYGSLVDVFAPGVSIPSAWIGSNSAYQYMSGTSMAAPHVAGLAAYFIAKEGLSGSSAVTAKIRNAATTNAVANTAGSPNLLAYNGSGR